MRITLRRSNLLLWVFLWLLSGAFTRAAAQPAPEWSTGLVSYYDAEAEKLASIGRFKSSIPCTGFLIATAPPDQAETAPAYFVTSGRCAEAWLPNDVILNRPNGDLTVVFDNFHDAPSGGESFVSKRTAFASSTGWDIAIVELEATYGDLLDWGYIPLELAHSDPQIGETILIAGAPSPRQEAPEVAFIRTSTCQLGPQVDLVESNWHFYGSYRTECRDIGRGSSGSPVISLASGEVIGVINTSTAGSPDENCRINRPCEVGDPGTKVYENASYAVPVFGIGGCFDGQGIFDINLPACPLENGKQTNLSRYDKRVPDFFSEHLVEKSDKLVWTGLLAGNGYRYYRYKIDLEAKTDCRDQSGYSAPIDLHDSPVIERRCRPRIKATASASRGATQPRLPTPGISPTFPPWCISMCVLQAAWSP